MNVFYLSFRTSEDPTRFKTISALPLGEPNIDTACRTKSPLAGVAIPPNFDLGGIRLPPNVKQFISFAKRSLMRKRMYQDFVFSISKFIKNEMSSRIFGMDKIPLRHFSTSFAGAKTTISFRSLTILLVTTLKTSKTFIVSKFWMNFMTDGRLQPQDFDRHSIFAAVSSCFLSEVQCRATRSRKACRREKRFAFL